MLRDKCLFIGGLKTGFRISELLALRVGDVFAHGEVLAAVTIERTNMKGKRRSRRVPINHAFQAAIVAWLRMSGMDDPRHSASYLFRSQKGAAIGPMQAWSILKNAFKTAGVTDRVASHSMRKTFASRCWTTPFVDRDIIKLMHLLGHQHFSSTARYVQFLDGSLDAAVLAI